VATNAPGEEEHARRGSRDSGAGDRKGRIEDTLRIPDPGPEAAAAAGGGRSARRRPARTRRHHGRHSARERF
jgi:hypothetical protein